MTDTVGPFSSIDTKKEDKTTNTLQASTNMTV